MAREIVSHVLAPFSLATIPKVAATSQRFALLVWADEDPTAHGQVHEHPALQRVVRRPVFALLRNPFDRLLSCYLDRIAGRRPSRDLVRRLGHPRTFAEFVVALGKYGTGIDTHTKTQTAHLAGVAPKFEGRLENPDSWETIRAETGLGALPILNPSRPRGIDLSKIWTPRTRDIAIDLYAEDFKRWNRLDP